MSYDIRGPNARQRRIGQGGFGKREEEVRAKERDAT